MSLYAQGRDREYRVRNDLTSNGYSLIARAAGSKGPADLVMGRDGVCVLVQVGTGNKLHMGPEARRRLVHAAVDCGAVPIVAVVQARQPIRYWWATTKPASEWTGWAP